MSDCMKCYGNNGEVHIKCDSCDGAGFSVDEDGKREYCDDCGGQGTHRDTCPECDGSGKIGKCAPEFAKMRTVCKNAHFTIAASRVSSGSDGLFTSEIPILHIPCLLLQYGFHSGGGNQFHIRVSRDSDPTDLEFPKNEITDPLVDRAWALQEERLSHVTLRSIH
ncbi:hypothetical protein VTL71DRAFT_12966 [Oculimacula yallundae]|uniref:Uncharacterized protein n=1 Tax=Oculimacula yallundae TaxID=86028 RepID=A0ABR4CR99_9HELO